MSDTLGIAVIGSSGIIGVRHTNVVDELESTKLVGVFDVNTEVAQGQAAERSVKWYQDFEDVLGDPEVDAVTLCVPNPLHHAMSLQAFKAGKHVLTEKPIAATLTQADEMVRTAREAGLTLGVVFNLRFGPEVVRMRRMLDEGELGDLFRTGMSQTQFRPQFYYDSAAWRGSWETEGGGVMWTPAIHLIDLYQWLGGMPKSVRGLASNLMHEIEVEDVASAVLEYDNGAHGLMHLNTIQGLQERRLELHGDLGSLVMTEDKLIHVTQEVSSSEFIRTGQGMFARPDTRVESVDIEEFRFAHYDVIDDFARAVLEGREPAITGEEGIKSLELISAVIMSSVTGKAVDLPLDRQAYDDLVAGLSSRGGLFRADRS